MGSEWNNKYSAHPELGRNFETAMAAGRTDSAIEHLADPNPPMLQHWVEKEVLSWWCCMCALHGTEDAPGRNQAIDLSQAEVCQVCAHHECGLCIRRNVSKTRTIFADGHVKTAYITDDCPPKNKTGGDEDGRPSSAFDFFSAQQPAPLSGQDNEEAPSAYADAHSEPSFFETAFAEIQESRMQTSGLLDDAEILRLMEAEDKLNTQPVPTKNVETDAAVKEKDPDAMDVDKPSDAPGGKQPGAEHEASASLGASVRREATVASDAPVQSGSHVVAGKGTDAPDAPQKRSAHVATETVTNGTDVPAKSGSQVAIETGKDVLDVTGQSSQQVATGKTAEAPSVPKTDNAPAPTTDPQPAPAHSRQSSTASPRGRGRRGSRSRGASSSLTRQDSTTSTTSESARGTRGRGRTGRPRGSRARGSSTRGRGRGRGASAAASTDTGAEDTSKTKDTKDTKADGKAAQKGQ